MSEPETGTAPPRPRGGPARFGPEVSPEHYLRLIWHRKWLVLAVFILTTVGTFAVSYSLPDVYVSDTLILVDPQKVPENYVKPTVTGDVRNRLGTLSQQILSATRLQKIIDSLNLYPEEKKTLPREDIITRMRKDISVRIVSDFGGSQDLQAFRISYSGRDPRLVAQVTNELAALFIEENLKAREQQATGTAEFLQNQLQETRKALEAQEAKLKEFKLQHIGELPEQQTAHIQILGQLQSQLQTVSDSLGRAQQQKTYLQSMMAQSSAPVVDLDEPDLGAPAAPERKVRGPNSLAAAKARLASLLTRYTDKHPDIQKLKRQIADEEANQGTSNVEDSPREETAAAPVAAPAAKPKRRPPVPVASSNPVLQSQLNAIDSEIAKYKEEQQRLTKLVASYQGKLERIPVREQQLTDLVRDYEISKTHYSQLLEKQLSAETATQLEIRQKGERFSILDPAQPAERPSWPNRPLINGAGSIAGLMLGVLVALATEFLGMSITAPEQLKQISGIPVLEVIPVIQTFTGRRLRRKRLIVATASGMAVTLLASCAFLFYRYGR